MKYIINSKSFFTLIWTIAFFYGAAIIMGLLSGGIILPFAILSETEISESNNFIKFLGTFGLLIPMIMGPIGFILSLLGKLPGTKRKQDTKASPANR